MIEPLLVRDVSLMWRAIIALTIGYSAFIAEIFRAGIQSVDKGQIEAAKALGLSRYQRFRLVVFPQAIRVILPPLGNDFVSMVKDSSLVSVLGVADITQMGKVYASGSFRFFETYSIVAYIYLILTIGLSLALRGGEKDARGMRQAHDQASEGRFHDCRSRSKNCYMHGPWNPSSDASERKSSCCRTTIVCRRGFLRAFPVRSTADFVDPLTIGAAVAFLPDFP